MKRRSALISTVLAHFLFLPTMAADYKHGLGATRTGGAVDCESCLDAAGFTGFSLFGKVGITRNWGVLITYRKMDQVEDNLYSLFLDEDGKYTQEAVQGVYMWRPDKRMRPHVKFGLEHTDFETKVSGSPSVSDDGTTLAGGGGFEAGSQRVAFFLDYDFTRVKFNLSGLANEYYYFANFNLGIVFKL